MQNTKDLNILNLIKLYTIGKSLNHSKAKLFKMIRMNENVNKVFKL